MQEPWVLFHAFSLQGKMRYTTQRIKKRNLGFLDFFRAFFRQHRGILPCFDRKNVGIPSSGRFSGLVLRKNTFFRTGTRGRKMYMREFGTIFGVPSFCTPQKRIRKIDAERKRNTKKTKSVVTTMMRCQHQQHT